MGESHDDVLRLYFDRGLTWQFRGFVITSDTGLLAMSCRYILSILFFTVFLYSSASAEMIMGTGVVPDSKIPSPIISDSIVRLDVPHIRQKTNLCVPTSAAMVLRYFGESYDPVVLKRYAEEHKPKAKRNRDFTYWSDMQTGLKKIKKYWRIQSYSRDINGFEQGLGHIKHSLRAGKPVLIEVHLGPGHTFVIMGYNDDQEVVYVRDPNISASKSRILSYRELLESWHNHKFHNSRSAFFANPN